MNAQPSVGWLLAAVLVFPSVVAAQSQGFDRAGRGSVSGRVLFSSSNSPAQRVEVTLAPVSGGMASTAQTGPDGEFQFNGLRQGTYILTVHEPGYELIQETVRVSGMEPGVMLSLTKTGAPPSGQAGDTVSVRELSIPENARKEFLKGVQRREKHDPAGSLPHFQRAVAAFPSYYEAYLQMGFAYNSLGKSEETEKAVRAAVELSSENFADADFALGELLGEENKFGDAEKPRVTASNSSPPPTWATSCSDRRSTACTASRRRKHPPGKFSRSSAISPPSTCSWPTSICAPTTPRLFSTISTPISRSIP